MIYYTTPLPQNPYNILDERRWHDAYSTCLKIEPASTDDIEKDVVYARILGYLILEAPTHASRDYISGEILNCEGNTTKLFELAEFFMSSVLPTFWNKRSKTVEKPGEFFDLPIEATPQNEKSAKRTALFRDSYHCMITRRYDLDYFLSHPEHAEMARELGTHGVFTVDWHIVPPLFAQGFPLDRAQTFILRYCSIPTDEVGQLAHGLTNIMTLAHSVVIALNRLDIWLEAVPDAENTFKPCSGIPPFLLGLPQQATFSTRDGLALPNPRYIEVHAAMCRIAQQSGVSKRRAVLVDRGEEDDYVDGHGHGDEDEDEDEYEYEYEGESETESWSGSTEESGLPPLPPPTFCR